MLISHEYSFFKDQEEFWKKIEPYISKKLAAKGDIIIHHGDSADNLWLILKGWVKLTRQTPDGKESITGLCADGDIFGEAVLFPSANYPYNAEILVDGTEIAMLPGNIIKKIIADNSAFSASIMAMLNERTSQAQLKLEHMTTMSAAQRLGCFLLRLCHTQANGEKTLQIPVEKNILATYLGMKAETLSRSQQQLKPLGITVSGHNITIENILKLRDYVCNSCSESGNCDAEDDN